MTTPSDALLKEIRAELVRRGTSLKAPVPRHARMGNVTLPVGRGQLRPLCCQFDPPFRPSFSVGDPFGSSARFPPGQAVRRIGRVNLFTARPETRLALNLKVALGRLLAQRDALGGLGTVPEGTLRPAVRGRSETYPSREPTGAGRRDNPPLPRARPVDLEGRTRVAFPPKGLPR